MNLNEFEEKIKAHGQNVRKYIAPPFDIEREELNNMRKSKKIITSFLLSAALICALAVTVFAAYNYLTAKQTAEELDYHILAESFNNDAPSEIITDGKYKAALLGITFGKNISEFEDVIPDRTYAAIAIEKTDGSDMTYDDEILVTPLIEGLKPWQYNIYTMDGGRQSKIIDGVLYTIVEFDSVEYFADRHIYLAVLDQTFYTTEAYNYDEKTGVISVNEGYNGTNILFELKVDKSKANPNKAAEYLDKIDKKINGDDVSDDLDEELGESGAVGENYYEEIKHIEISTDENSNFVIRER